VQYEQSRLVCFFIRQLEFVANVSLKKPHIISIGIIKLSKWEWSEVLQAVLLRWNAKYGNLDVSQYLREVRKSLLVTSANSLKSIRKKYVYNWLRHQINAVWRSVHNCGSMYIARFPTSASLRRMLIRTSSSDPLICAVHHIASQTSPPNPSLQWVFEILSVTMNQTSSTHQSLSRASFYLAHRLNNMTSSTLSTVHLWGKRRWRRKKRWQKQWQWIIPCDSNDRESSG
jgi:hypothetical protein